MSTLGIGFAVAVVAILVVIAAVGLLVARLFHKVEQGKALVVSTMRDVQVTFTGQVVLPVVHKAEVMDISVKTIEIERRGGEGLICQDNIRADIKVAFFVKVNKTAEDVIKVAQSIGCVRASDQITLDELFNAKFSEALKTVGKQLDFVDLYTKRQDFRDRIIQVIGTDLNGYVLEDAAIDFLEQTPIGLLDGNNILDAQGIRKITELTAIQHVHTNHSRQDERKQITQQNVEAQEAILEMERQQADAEARQQREVSTLRAREEAETAKVANEERLKAESARISTDQSVDVAEENRQREVAVADLNRQRVVAVEEERIEKDRQVEVIAREREVELNRISKDKELEIERRAIAEEVRERIAVEKTVAEQEESIKRLRVVEEAERNREATVIAAEAEAQEALVRDIKAAEAAEEASRSRAKEQLTLAEAGLQAADLDAKAGIRMAEATQATEAAAGLAQADVTRKMGDAEGEAMAARLRGEAEGLTEKAAAMAALDDATRSHEEFRMRVDAHKEVALSDIEARREVAEAQAEVLGTALSNADIDIIGGDGQFFDRIAGAISMGKGVDGFIENSDTARMLGGSYLSGDRDLADDLSSALGGSGPAGLRDLTITALLGSLMVGAGDDGRAKLDSLRQAADDLGLGDTRLGELGAQTADVPQP